MHSINNRPDNENISNTEVQSSNYWCNGDTISITYPGCVFIACMPLIIIAAHAQLYNFLPHYLINGTIFSGGELLDIKFVLCFSLPLNEPLLILIWPRDLLIPTAYLKTNIKIKSYTSVILLF